MIKEIILYSTDCPRCKILKNKLKDKDISYIEKNSVDEMISLGITQVPVLSIDGQMYEFLQAVKWINER